MSIFNVITIIVILSVFLLMQFCFASMPSLCANKQIYHNVKKSWKYIYKCHLRSIKSFSNSIKNKVPKTSIITRLMHVKVREAVKLFYWFLTMFRKLLYLIYNKMRSKSLVLYLSQQNKTYSRLTILTFGCVRTVLL